MYSRKNILTNFFNNIDYLIDKTERFLLLKKDLHNEKQNWLFVSSEL
jgi:hypothetical protein